MNKWIQKSIDLANSPGYLDKLYQIYPMELGEIRSLESDTLKELKEAFESKDLVSIIKYLLKNVDLFPIKDSYVAFLRRHPNSLDNNPETVARIGGRLLKMGFEEVIKSSTQPKETNRQIGPLFRRSLTKLGLPLLSKEDFLKNQDIAILDGSDHSLGLYAREHFHIRIKKGLDLVAKVRGHIVLGEAKFLTDFGGHQNAQLNDALELLKKKEEGITRVAILDGVVWVPGKNKLHTHVKKNSGTIISALLLRDFLLSLR